MRRFFLAATILSIVASGPLQAMAGDREIAEQIIQKLKVQRDAGTLKGFTLDLKVDKGVVLLRGSVREAAQKKDVLAVAQGIEGINQVIDEISVAPAGQPAAEPTGTASVVRPKATVSNATTEAKNEKFSFKEALAANQPKPDAVAAPAAKAVKAPAAAPAPAAPVAKTESAVVPIGLPSMDAMLGGVEMAAAVESPSSIENDRNITSQVVSALGTAQRQGQLKGFGVDVNTQDGRGFITGRCSSEAQRSLITNLARRTPGVVDVVDEIAVYNAMSEIPEPIVAGRSVEPAPLMDLTQPLTPMPNQGVPAMTASTRTGVQAQQVPYQMQPGGMQGTPVNYGMGGGVAGCPVPMGPYAGGAAGPRYEQPYLPNYAWPGYAAYPNYAAVSYPQQYSPSAFPYIGPFYPYPQVPLGWRKVSLEWDDGWWMLDFTDR